MPRKDGTGPRGEGPGTGRDMGQSSGSGGGGRGSGGYCVCPSCGKRVTHRQGKPCLDEKCPKCQTAMTRE